MLICEFCGTELPDQAHFCSTCGKRPDDIADTAAGSEIPPGELHALADKPTIIGQPDAKYPFVQDEARLLGEQTELAIDARDFPDNAEDDEEERQRLLLLPPAGNVPRVQGTPSLGSTPNVLGTPSLGGAPAVIPAGSYRPPSYPGVSPQNLPLVLPKPTTVMEYPPATYGFGPDPSIYNQPPPARKPKPGCNLLIALLLVPFLILGGLLGLSVTIYAPNLTIMVNGSTSTTVASGGQFSLHGNKFIPDTNVTLTLDDTPLYVNIPSYSSQQAQSQATHQLPLLFAGHGLLSSQGSNTVSAGSDGVFAVTIHVGPDWRLGIHVLEATENLSPRSAKVSLTVVLPGTVVTPIARPSATTTVTPTGTVTGTPGSTGLSTITPDAVHLGPLAEGSSQTASSLVTLNTGGTKLLSWTATWDHLQNSWLQLSLASGQIQAPSSQPLTVSAQTGALTAGTYTATVTFNSTVSAQTVSLTIIFTVQSACITATPNILSFTTSTGGNDPTPQTVTLGNCGQQINAWSLAQANNLPAWLSVSPMNGTLNNGDTQNITVSVTNADEQLKTGSNNQATLQFVSGSSQVVIQVTFTIGSGATLNVSNATLANCPFNQDSLIPGNYTCDEVLSVNTPTQSVSVNWTVTSTGVAGILFTDTNNQPLNSGTILAGQTVQIEVHIPRTGCPTTATIIFTGPTNSVPVTWSC